MKISVSKFKRTKIGIVVIFFVLVSAMAFSITYASEVPPDWIKVSVGSDFDLMAPAGTSFRPGKAIDSNAGEIVTPDFTLSFDYGLYSNPLNDMSRYTNHETHDARVDGKPALIVTANTPRFPTDRPYFIGIHFPKVKTSILGAVKLTIEGQLDVEDRYTTVERMFRTIRFK